MNKMLTAAVTIAGCAFIAASAQAQGWPDKAVTLVVPFTAGTTSDVIARSFADYLAAKIGKPVVIDNKGGAGGNIGGVAAAKAAPDGYTFLFSTTGPAATNKLMYKEMSFDPQKDLTPIGLIGKSPIIIAARPNLPAATMQEFIAAATKSDANFSVGYPGNGTLGHVTGALLQVTIGTKFAETQHRGSASIINDLMGGHLDLGMDSMAAYVPQVEAGKLKALAIASAKRWPKLPNVPTVAESGIPGFEASVWYAVLAPTGTNADIVSKMNAHVNAFIAEEKTRTLFAELGIETSGGTPQELKSFIETEMKKWAPVIKAAGIQF